MMPAAGDLVAGKYRIERKLAEGGMGILFEATHLQLDELVAIKFLREEVAACVESDAVERFVREARSSIKIRSEHVVRILDVAALESGIPYIVMELLVGQDLDQILAQSGPLPPTDAVDCVLQTCEALAEAHQRGIIHRDIKPANLFMTRRADGSASVKLLDFGISKVSAPGGKDLGITNTQAVMGSPRYMSPEQLRASKDVDARSDIWALGIVLYELLTGAPPFDGETMTAVCVAILQDQPASMTSRREIAPGLERVVHRALEKDPALRFASIAELAEGLRAYASASGVTSVARVLGTLRGSQYSLAPGGVTQSTGSTRAAGPAPSALTSTAWTDGNMKGRSKRSIAALAAGAAAVAVLAVISGLGYYAHYTKSAQAAASSGLVSTATAEGSELPGSQVPAPSLPPPGDAPATEPAADAPAASSEHVQSAVTQPPPRGVGVKAAPPHPATPTATATATATAPPPSTASAPTLWGGRK